MNQPPFTIVAAGVTTTGLSPGQVAQNTCLCTLRKGVNPGQWQVQTDDDSLVIGQCVLILSPGDNLAKGLSFGQPAQNSPGNLFSFEIYRNDTGDSADLGAQFIIVKYPGGE